MKLDEYFTTPDLGLASALLYHGFNLETLDRTEKARVLFVFSRRDGLDDVIQTYWAGKLSVEPQTFMIQLKLLKNRIYGE